MTGVVPIALRLKRNGEEAIVMRAEDRRGASSFALAAGGLAASMFASVGDVHAQGVMGVPNTYDTYVNNTVPGTTYVPNAAQTYVPNPPDGSNPRYLPAATQAGTGVPLAMAYLVTTDGQLLPSSALPLNPGRQPLVTGLTARNPVDNSFAGLINQFAWGSADIVMTPSFSGGFAFNMGGSLRDRHIPYTFSASANYSELSFGLVFPPGTAPNQVTDVVDFTQGQATGALTMGMFNSFDNGRAHDPWTVLGAAYVPPPPSALPNNLVGVTPPFLATFESPVYASADLAPSTRNNGRTYFQNPTHLWAVLAGFTGDTRVDFEMDIEREYAAILAAGVPLPHIAVLYGTGATPALPNFTGIDPANNQPPNPPAAVPVNGATTFANIQGLLNPTRLVQPGGNNYWQELLDSGIDSGVPQPGDGLVLYVTGHGSEVNLNGVSPFETFAAGRLGVLAHLPVPANAQVMLFAADAGDAGTIVAMGSTITIQMATSRPLPSACLAGGCQFTIGDLVAGVTVNVPLIQVFVGGSPPAVDMSAFLNQAPGSLVYYDFVVPQAIAAALHAGQPLDLFFTSSDVRDLGNFIESTVAFSLMDDSPANCLNGACEILTDTVAPPFFVPALSAWQAAFLALSLVAAVYFLVKRPRGAPARAGRSPTISGS
jgi:hypothetical protein